MGLLPANHTTAPRNLDPSSAIPLYRQLASQLLALIDSGVLPPGQRLPSEPELMAQHGVSRVTVRQAIALLQRAGKLRAHRGKGTYVTDKVVRHDLEALQGFHESLRRQGIEPETTLLDWSEDAGALNDEVPAGLSLPVRMRRLYAVDGRPFAVVTGYLPAAAAALGRARAERLAVYDILGQFMGVTVDHADVTIRCQRPPADVARLLGTGRAGMVLLMERQSFNRNRQVLELMRIYILPERYEFRLRVSGALELARGVHQVSSASSRQGERQ